MEHVINFGERNLGGGLIGIIVAFPFIKLLGTLGTVILLLGLAIIFLVLIFGFKPSEFISNFLYDMEEKKIDRREQEIKLREEERKQNKSNNSKIYDVEEDSINVPQKKETK